MRLPEPFNPALYPLPTEVAAPALPCGHADSFPPQPFLALTVYAVKGGYQAGLCADERNCAVVSIKPDAFDAIKDCFKQRFG